VKPRAPRALVYVEPEGADLPDVPDLPDRPGPSLSDKSDVNALIAQLAARQHGHVTRGQLLEAGLARRSITSRAASGRLVRVHAGVYAVGYRRVEPAALAMAAVLAAGPGAVLSHDSALALWGLRRWPQDAEVIAPRCVRRPGIVAHRSVTLTRSQRTLWLGVPVTRAARAISDLGARLTAAQRVRLANHGRLEGLISAAEAQALLGHRRNPTRSGLEDDFQRFVERHRLPQPLTNVEVSGFEVDAYWPEHRLIVELDGAATHGDPATFVSDRARDAAHAAAGIRTIRLLAENLRGEGELRTAELLRRALSAADHGPGEAVLAFSYGLLDEL
jgi:very-short-patch-repair endonuclease